jgi:hypothetical protein
LTRLRAGTAVLGIPVGWPPKDSSDIALGQAIAAVAEAAGLVNASAQLTLTRRPVPRGVLPPVEPSPTMLITAAALPPSVPPANAIIGDIAEARVQDAQAVPAEARRMLADHQARRSTAPVSGRPGSTQWARSIS